MIVSLDSMPTDSRIVPSSMPRLCRASWLSAVAGAGRMAQRGRVFAKRRTERNATGRGDERLRRRRPRRSA